MQPALRSLASIGLAAAFFGCFACSDSNPAANLPDGSVSESDAAAGADAGVSGSDAASPGSDASSRDSGGGTSDASSPGGDAGAPIIDQCDPVAQTGCDMMTEKCVVENLMPRGGTQCAPIGTDVGLGMMCTGSDCEAGLVCVRTSSTASECQKVCDFGSGVGCEALGNDFECNRRLTDTNWGACVRLGPICDQLTQTPCSQDQACQPVVRRTGQWEFRCREAGTQGEGQSCGSSGGGTCQRGLVCIRSVMMGTAACRRYCDMNEDCAMPQMCNGEVNDPPFMYCGN